MVQNNQIEKNRNSRLDWIDVAKGYGMLFVIWAHLPNEGLNTWIYSFHMPLFFFLSGYVFSMKYEFRVFAKRKVKSMVIPYFCLGIPMFLFQSVRYYIEGTLSFEKCIEFLVDLIAQNRFQTLWYMACLFWLNLLFYGLVKWIKSEQILGVVSFVLAGIGIFYYSIGGPSLFWNMDACLTAMPFFFAGYSYKMHREKVDSIFLGKRKWICFLGAVIINVSCYYLTWEISGCGLEMFYCQYGSPVFTYVSAFAGIIWVVIVSHQWTIRWVRYIGENSMLYYAWHQLMMIPIAKVILWSLGFSEWGSVGYMILYKLACTIMILGMTTVCNEVIKRSKMGFMLGKG